MRCPTLAELPPPPAGKQGWPWTESSPPWPTPQAVTAAVDAAWPTITVVTPVYNAAAFIEETLRSVLLQGYPNLEYIVIDGGSSDGTAAIIQRYAPWLTYWCNERDRGQAHALNKGFARATGAWLAWLNADDLYLPGALYQVATAAQQTPTPHWIVGVLRWIDAQGEYVGVTAPTPFADVSNPAQWRGVRWLAQVCFRGSGLFCPQPVSFWSRTAHAAVGPFDESLHYAMDLDRWGTLAYGGFTPTLIPAELASFRLHGRQKSADGELPFLVDELAIVDHWLRKSNGPDYETLATYRVWLQEQMQMETQTRMLQQRQRQWHALMRQPACHALFTLARTILHSTSPSKRLLQQLNKRRPAWMYFYG